MNLVVSTCGTSTLTNLADSDTRKLVVEYANAASADDVPGDVRTALLRLIDQAKAKLNEANIASTKKASAELNGILSLACDRTPLPSADVHVLVHTDTWLGTATAQIVADKLQTYGITPQLEKITSLTTKSREQFDDGLCNLVTWAAQTIRGYRQSKYLVIFNLVGGFKSVQGFMQTLGMFYADEIVYIFENGGELLRIPRLPVDLDEAARQLMTRHASIFRRLDILGAQTSQDIPKDISESLLYTIGSETDLSPWGKLLWSAHKSALYATRLLESPTDHSHISQQFANDCNKLESKRIAAVNERVDDLVRYLHSGQNPCRLDVKQLKGNPKPPSTHEADAWADGNPYRIFFHYNADNNVILDRLQPALH